MAFTDADQARLDALDALLGRNATPQAPVAPPPEPMGTGERILRQVGNLPTNAAAGLLNLVGDTLQIGSDAPRVRAEAANPFDIPAPRSTSDSLVDMGANLVSSLPAYLIPELGVARLAGAAGAAPLLARAVGAGAAGYLNTQGTEGQAEGATQGAIFAGLAGLGGLSRTARLLPALGLGAVAGGVAKASGASDDQALLQGGITSFLGMLPGQHVNPQVPMSTDLVPTDGVTHNGPQTVNPMVAARDARRAVSGKLVVTDGITRDFPMDRQGNPVTDADFTFMGSTPNVDADVRQPLLGFPDNSPIGARPPETSQFFLDTDGTVTQRGPRLLQDQQHRNIVEWAHDFERQTGQPPTQQQQIEWLNQRYGPRGANFDLGAGSEPSRPSLFRLGDDTTQMPNEGLPGRAPQFSLLDRDQQIPPDAINVTPRAPDVTAPFGEAAPASRMNGGTPHVVSTAVHDPMNNRVLIGLRWNDPHEGIGTYHEMGNPPQELRGFLVDDGTGAHHFADRATALEYAQKGGQLPDNFRGELNSTDLQDPVLKKGTGDAPPVKSDETSQPQPEPLSKSEAASGGVQIGSDEHLLRSDISGMTDLDARNEIQDRRDIINHPETPDVEKPYHLGKIREAMGLPDLEPELPAEDSPRLQQLRDQRYDAAGRSDVAGRYGEVGHEAAMERVENEGLSFEDSQKLNEFDPQEEAEAQAISTPHTEMQNALEDILNDKSLDIDYAEAERQAARDEAKANPAEADETSQPEPAKAEAAKPKRTRKKPETAAEVTRDIAERNPKSKKAAKAARKTSKPKMDQASETAVDSKMLDVLSRFKDILGPGKGAGFDPNVLHMGGSFLPRTLQGVLIGGYAGEQYDQENRLRGFIYGATLGGLGFKFGPKLFRILMNEGKVRLQTEMTNLKNVTSQPGAEWADVLHNMAAEDAGATGDGLARILRRIQKGLTLSDDAREVMSRSNLSGMLSGLRSALEGMRNSYEGLSSAERDTYAKYAKEPAYVKDPATGNMVPNRAVETQFLNDMNGSQAAAQFASKAMVARSLRVEAQEMIANSMLPDALKTAISESLGTYQTDAFRIFNEGSYRPTDQMIDKAVDELHYNDLFTGYNKMALRKIVSSYLDGIYRNRALYTGGSGNARTLDQILHGKMKLDPGLEAKILKASGMKSVDEVVTSQYVLPKDLRESLTKAISDGTYLTPAFRDMLGYYADPLEKEAATLTKLVPAARVAKQFELITAGKNKLGLDFAMNGVDYSNLYSTLTARLKTALPAEKDLINKQLLDLRNRTPLPQSEAYGVLSGKFVPTDLADTLPDMDKGVYGVNTTAVGRGVDQFNRFLKVGQTAMNPVSHIRQIMTTPLLGMLAGTSPSQIWEGFRVAASESNRASALARLDPAARAKYLKVLERMRSLGIADTAGINTEFNTAARQALTGYYDRTLMDKFLQTKGVGDIVNAYHYPDTALRIGTFLKHEQRLLSRFAPDVAMGRLPDAIPKDFMTGKPVDQIAAKWAEREALRYTNRYTMNYANIPGGLAAMRKMPFVSLYLSYQYEIARVMKNITMDAINGTGMAGDVSSNRLLAGAKLAGVAAVPFALEQLSKSNLSEKDRKDWELSRQMDQPYARDRFKYVMGRRADGSFKYLDFSPLIPTDEWNRFFRAASSGSPRDVLANNPVFGLDNTPALNVASELITGNSSRTGRPINTFARAADAARQEIAPAMFGGYEFDNLMRALQANDKGELGIQRLGSGKGYSIGDLAFTYATGLRPTSVNVDWQRHTTVQNMQNQVQVERQYLMDTMRSNVTPEVKQLAVKRYNDAVQSIVAHFGQQVKDVE